MPVSIISDEGINVDTSANVDTQICKLLQLFERRKRIGGLFRMSWLAHHLIETLDAVDPFFIVLALGRKTILSFQLLVDA